MAWTIYKKGQGTAARGMASVLAILLGLWAAHSMWYAVRWSWVPRLIATAIVWFIFGGLPLYLVLFNERVAELLIETQQEMRKVAWSSRSEVLASTVVVLITVAFLSLFIFVTDFLLLKLAGLVGIY